MSVDPARERSSARVAALAIWSGRVEPVPLAGGITNRTSRSRIAAAATSCASATTSPCTASCARTSWLRAARRIWPVSARAWCTRSPACWSSTSSRDAPSRRRTCATRPISSGWSTWCGAATGTFRNICAGRPRCSGCSMSCATTRTRSREGDSRHVPLLTGSSGARRATGGRRRPDRGGLRPQRPAGGQLHRRRAAALARRLGLCRLQLAAVRSRRPCLQQRAFPRAGRAGLEPLFRQTRRRSIAPPCRRHDRASLLRETMWSMVSEIHSTVDFDYAAYTAENLRASKPPMRPIWRMDRA